MQAYLVASNEGSIHWLDTEQRGRRFADAPEARYEARYLQLVCVPR